MSAKEAEAFLAGLSEEAPCGEDLAYDPEYAELERAIQGTPEQQVGDKIIEAEEPNYREVQKLCVSLFKRTKDLRVAVYYTLSSMRLTGLPGLDEGLTVVHGFIDKYWDSFHPQLDPDDNNDPTERMNIIGSLAPESSFQDPLQFPQRLIEAPLVTSPQIGKLTMRHVLMAKGELKPVGDEKPTDPAMIDAAFGTGKADEITANAAAIGSALDLLTAIDTKLGELVGPTNVPNLDTFLSKVKQIKKLFDERAPSAAGAPAGDAAGAATAADGGAAPAAAAPPPQQGVGGVVRSRDDVVKALDMITNYYRGSEPSSPVPLLMQRARRLVEKNFLEIVEDMTPKAVPEIATILGTEKKK